MRLVFCVACVCVFSVEDVYMLARTQNDTQTFELEFVEKTTGQLLLSDNRHLEVILEHFFQASCESGCEWFGFKHAATNTFKGINAIQNAAEWSCSLCHAVTNVQRLSIPAAFWTDNFISERSQMVLSV